MTSFHIVIGSFVGSPWLAECVASLPKDIPAIVVLEPNYECGKLRFVHQRTDLDEFLFLPDSTRVKRHGWIYEMREHTGHSVAVCPEPAPFGAFMGKYRRAVMDAVPPPETLNKRAAVDAEAQWTRAYFAKATELEGIAPHVMFPDFQHGPNPTRIEMKHFRANAVVENDHLVKWKGCWNGCLMSSAQQRDDVATGRK